MSGSSNLGHELAALHAELNKPSKASATQQPRAMKHETVDGANSSLAADLEQQLNELSKALSEYSGSIEDFIAEHPLASVLGAFVAGLALGRVMGRA